MRLAFSMALFKLVKGRLIKMKANFLYPLYISIDLNEINAGSTLVKYCINIGYKNKFLCALPDMLVEMTLFSAKASRSAQKHIIEEYKNLENML
jgi:hypothetical protein